MFRFRTKRQNLRRRSVSSRWRIGFETLEHRELLSADPLGPELLVNSDFTGVTQRTFAEADAIAANANGGFTVVYGGRGSADANGIYVRTLDGSGIPVGNSQLVNQTTLSNQLYGSVAQLGNESVVVWSGRGVGDTAGVFLRKLNAAGIPMGLETRVNQTLLGTQETPAVTSLSTGGFVIAWAGRGVGDSNGIFARRYAADGTPLGNEFRVNSTTNATQKHPSIAPLDGGGFMIAWDGGGTGDSSGVFMQRFNASGNPLGTETRVNSTTTGTQSYPDIASDALGNAVVTWHGNGSGDSSGVYLQRLNASGLRIGGEQRVNSYIIGEQLWPNVAMGTDDQFAVTWSSRPQDGSTWGVFAQEYNSNGTKIGAAFPVPTTTQLMQRYSNVAFQTSGSYAIVWSGNGDGDRQGVFARTFGAANAVPQIEPIADRSLNETETLSFTVSAVDPDHPSASLVFSLEPGAPAGTAIDPSSGLFLWTPTESQGPASVTIGVRVTDPLGASSVREFDVIVAETNESPAIDDIADQTLEQQQVLTLTVSASDPDLPANQLTYSLDTGAPSGMTIDSATGVLHWVPTSANQSGEYSVTVSVTDDGTPAIAQNRLFNITLLREGDNVPPVISATLANDTGLPPFSNDMITSDTTVVGSIVDTSEIVALKVWLDNTPPASALDVLSELLPDGTFSLEPAIIAELAGGTLSQGPHTLHFLATDQRGNVSLATTLSFTYDSVPPVITISSPVTDGTLGAESRLEGVVTDATSMVIQASYQLGATPTQSILFAEPGTIGQPLTLDEVLDGSTTLRVDAIDLAGNIANNTRNVTVTRPFGVLSHTPLVGAVDVGSTYRPQVFFSRPVDPASLTAETFFATFGDEKLTANIVPANDGSFAWLFFDDPLPSGARVTVTVTGDVQSADGAALDGDGDGVAGGDLAFDFTTVSLIPLPGTSLSGKIVDPGPDLIPHTADDSLPGPDGQFRTADDTFLLPIAGVKVFLLGLEDQFVFTDLDGRFHFDAVPVGNVKIDTDGRTAPNQPAGYYFPDMVMDATMRLGENNFVMPAMEVMYLPRLHTSILQTVSATAGAQIVVNEQGAPDLSPDQRQYLTIDVQPNSLIGADGLPLSSAEIGISTVPPELVRDMLPPGVLQHTFDITVQAMGVSTFSQPAPMTFPNVFNASPGSKLNFLSFDHTTGRLVIEGTVTVSADGRSVSTDPNTGITHPGWHGMTPAGSTYGGSSSGPPTTDGSCDPGTPEEAIPAIDASGLKDYFFHNDDGEIKLRIANKAPEDSGSSGCNPPANPSVLKVRMSFDSKGIASEFLENLPQAAFSIGPGEEKTVEMQLKKLLGRIKSIERDRMYGVELKIEFETGKGKPLGGTELYIYRFLDAADDKHDDGTVEFADTIKDGFSNIDRKRELEMRVGPNSQPIFEVEDTTHFLSTGFPQKVLLFDPVGDPDTFDEDLHTKLKIKTPDELEVGTLELMGDGSPKYKLNVNKSELKSILSQIASGGDLNVNYVLLTSNERALFDTDQERQAIADAVQAGLTSRFAELNQGIEIVDNDGSENAINLLWKSRGRTQMINGTVFDSGLFGASGEVAFAGIPVPGAPHVEGGNGNDNANAINEVIANSSKYSSAERNFRLSEAINQVPQSNVEVYVDNHMEFQLQNIPFQLTTEQLVNALVQTAAHEGSHTLGAPHPTSNVDNPIDAVEQQVVTLSGDLANGSFQLGFLNDVTLPIPGNSAAIVVQTALQLLPSLLDNVTVTGPAGGPYVLQFTKNLVGVDLPQVIPFSTSLGVNVATTINGASHEVPGLDLVGGRTDIMFDGHVDWQGELRFRSGVTLEVNKMGLKIDWTETDADRVYNLLSLIRGRSGNLSATADEILGLPKFVGPVLFAFEADQPALNQPYDFGVVSVDGELGERAARTITLVNVGTEPVVLHSVSIDANSGISLGTPIIPETIVAAGASYDIQLVFDPQRGGLYESTLHIDSNAENFATEVFLQGTGIEANADVRLSVPMNNLGGADVLDSPVALPDAATLTNIGSQPLVVTQIGMEDNSGQFSFIDLPAVSPSQPLTLQPGESLGFGLQFSALFAGLQRASLAIATNDPDTPIIRRTIVGTGIPQDSLVQFGRDFVAVETPFNDASPVLRQVSDDHGNWQVFLPDNSAIHVVQFDPQSGLVAHDYDVTAGSGDEKIVSEPFFFASVASDSDDDGLPDDIEFAIGSSANDSDSDNDGVDDFLEIQLNSDPLGGQGLRNGVVAIAAIPGIATEVVIEASPTDGRSPLAFVASATGNNATGGLYVVDVNTFSQPTIIGVEPILGANSDVAVDLSTRTAVIAAGTSGVHLVDISNPARPVHQTTLQFPQAVGRLETYQGRAYLISGTSVIALDLTTGNVVQTLNLAGATLTDLTRAGTTLFTYDTNNTVRAIELSPSQLIPRGAVSVPSLALGGKLFAGDGVLYASAAALAGAPGFSTINTSNLDNLQLISPVDNQAVSFANTGFAVNGSGLLVAVGAQTQQPPSVDVLNISDPTVTDAFLTRYNTPAFATGVAIGSGMAFVAGGTSGMIVVNFRELDSFGVVPTAQITASVSDTNVNLPGTQITAGQLVPVFATVTEDIQTREVELLVNGTVVARDLSYPFDFQYTPSGVAMPTTVQLQIRAIDTAGNASLSNSVVFEIVPTNPHVLSTVPAPQSTTTSTIDELVIEFDSPMDTATLAPSDILLVGDGPDNTFSTSDDLPVPIDFVSFNPTDRILSLRLVTPLPNDTYRVTLPANKLRDQSGNELDGEFTGQFPTGDGFAGGNTVFTFSVAVPSSGIAEDAFAVPRLRMVELADNEKLDDRFTAVEGTPLDRRGNSNIVVEDFNDDGRLDLARATYGTIYELTPAGTTQSRTFNAVAVRLQRPDGTFDEPINVAVGSHPRAVHAADVNGDDILDLITVNVADSANGLVTQLPFELSILLGDGTGAFAPEVRVATGITIPANLFELPQIAIGQFNSDAQVDIAVLLTTSATISSPFFNVQSETVFFAGNGDGTFLPAVSASTQTGSAFTRRRELFAADVNGDNFTDLITPEHILVSSGNGTFAPTLVSGTTGLRVIAVADFTGDAIPDLLTEFGSGNTVTLTLLQNNGFGSFTSIPSAASQGNRASGNGIAADINGDGIPDWIVPNPSRALSIHLANPDFTFQRFAPLPMSSLSQTANHFINVVAADVDGDGHRDIVSTRQGDEAALVVIGRGDGTFRVPSDTLPRIAGPGSFPTLTGTRQLLDMNNDGVLDLVGNGRTSTISSVESFLVFHGNGNGTFAPAVATSPARPFFSLGTVDGDAFPDVASTDALGNVTLLRGLGNGGFAAAEVIASLGFDGFNNAARAIQLTDATGDGNLDVAVLHRRGITILPGNGDGTFSAPVETLTPLTVDRNFFSTIDLNNDNRSDFVIPRADGLRLLLSNADGTVSDAGQLGTPPVGLDHRLAFGDFNGDNATDIALITNANQTTFIGQLLVFLNHGNGTFDSALRIAVDDYTGIRTADIDGDGALDIITSGLHEVAIHAGLGDGSFASAVRFDLSGPQTSFPTEILVGDVTSDDRADIIGYAFLLPQ